MSASEKRTILVVDDEPEIRKLVGPSTRVIELGTLSVRNRIHAKLLRLSRPSATERNTAIISPIPTHANIASFISTHREAITRELNDLARAGRIAEITTFAPELCRAFGLPDAL